MITGISVTGNYAEFVILGSVLKLELFFVFEN